MPGMSGMVGRGCSPGMGGSVRREVFKNDTSPESSSRGLNRFDVVIPVGVEVDIPKEDEVAIWEKPVMVLLLLFSLSPPVLVFFALPAFPLLVI